MRGQILRLHCSGALANLQPGQCEFVDRYYPHLRFVPERPAPSTQSIPLQFITLYFRVREIYKFIIIRYDNYDLSTLLSDTNHIVKCRRFTIIIIGVLSRHIVVKGKFTVFGSPLHQKGFRINFMTGSQANFPMEFNTSEFETCSNADKTAYYAYWIQVI